MPLHLLDYGSFPVHLVLCLPCVYCNPLFVFFFYIAMMYLLSLFSNVPPMHTHTHLVHVTWYTKPFLCFAGWALLFGSMRLGRLFWPLCICIILSLTPLTYVRWRNWGVGWSCASAPSSCAVMEKQYQGEQPILCNLNLICCIIVLYLFLLYCTWKLYTCIRTVIICDHIYLPAWQCQCRQPWPCKC